jgi:hypothetical protein
VFLHVCLEEVVYFQQPADTLALRTVTRLNKCRQAVAGVCKPAPHLPRARTRVTQTAKRTMARIGGKLEVTIDPDVVGAFIYLQLARV